MSFLAMEACPRIPVVMVMFFRTTIIWLSLLHYSSYNISDEGLVSSVTTSTDGGKHERIAPDHWNTMCSHAIIYTLVIMHRSSLRARSAVAKPAFDPGQNTPVFETTALSPPPRSGPRNGPFRANRMMPKSSNTMQNQQTTSNIPLDHESSRLTSPLAMRNCPCCVLDHSWPPLPKFHADTSNPCYTGHYKYPHHYHNTPQN